MPLYELFCIAAHNPTSPHNLKQLIDSLSRQVYNNGGVIRDLKNLGIGVWLPKRFKRHQQVHKRGDHFLMSFDTSPQVLRTMNRQLGGDPLVVKWTIIKKGEKLSQLIAKPHPSIGFEDASRRSDFESFGL